MCDDCFAAQRQLELETLRRPVCDTVVPIVRLPASVVELLELDLAREFEHHTSYIESRPHTRFTAVSHKIHSSRLSAMATASAAAALGPNATSSGNGGMEGLLPLVLQLTNPEQVRETRKR